jgi:hypothetical protein
LNGGRFLPKDAIGSIPYRAHQQNQQLANQLAADYGCLTATGFKMWTRRQLPEEKMHLGAPN